MIAKIVALTGEAYYLLSNLDVDYADFSLDSNELGVQFGLAVFVF